VGSTNEKSKTALIIEDDYSIFLVLDLMLQDKEIHSVHADSLAETKAVIEKISPEIIFVDNWLPDGSGIEFIPVLRQKFSNALIITMTAQSTAENKNLSFINGSDIFIEKPFAMNDIYKSLSSRNI
jgi:two-component system response regulator PilR (NtrC family)